MDNDKRYTAREEHLNAITHLLGVFVLLGSLYWFLPVLFRLNDGWAYVAYGVMYGGILSSYVASFAYHAASPGVRKRGLRKFDHAAIYLNIAGSYTPYMLYVLREEGYWGWGLLSVVWLGAVLGIGLNFRKMKRTNHLKTLSYLAMGWVVVFALKPLLDVLTVQGRVEALYWLGAEALFFSLGALIYMFAKREFMHAVWHLFVLGGTISHLVSAYLILP